MPIVMSLAAGPRHFISVPEGICEGEDLKESAVESTMLQNSGHIADVDPHLCDASVPAIVRAASTSSAADVITASDAAKGAVLEVEAGVVGECCKEVGAEEKLLLSIDGRSSLRAHDCVLLTGERVKTTISSVGCTGARK